MPGNVFCRFTHYNFLHCLVSYLIKMLQNRHRRSPLADELPCDHNGWPLARRFGRLYPLSLRRTGHQRASGEAYREFVPNVGKRNCQPGRGQGDPQAQIDGVESHPLLSPDILYRSVYSLHGQFQIRLGSDKRGCHHKGIAIATCQPR